MRVIVTPTPKISQLTALRPVSVTPILSRLFERFIVCKFILPILPNTLFQDQFVFRPSGSTTAALTCLVHLVICLLRG
jgi:hypothetical protein